MSEKPETIEVQNLSGRDVDLPEQVLLPAQRAKTTRTRYTDTLKDAGILTYLDEPKVKTKGTN